MEVALITCLSKLWYFSHRPMAPGTNSFLLLWILSWLLHVGVFINASSHQQRTPRAISFWSVSTSISLVFCIVILYALVTNDSNRQGSLFDGGVMQTWALWTAM